ncbi:unnamed protein product [Symbiodinium microadriaticum]|nr:unnamed protein product [Symbiodinium microadriaticum]
MKRAFLFSLSIVLAIAVFAQQDFPFSQQNPAVPLDDNVKVGKLENGFTYILRNNGYPENRVEFRLVVNAGSMQEDDDQLGIAHFVEHMAFNGSENFEKNDLVNFLQSIGVKFGADLNAYTSFEETVYILPLPSDKPEIVDQGLTVLEDWAGGVSFDHEEIDKERGVVIEEWRLGQGAQQRMRDEYFPVLFKDSRYADRLPIGTRESIETVPYQRVKDFYNRWYRPDNMALVAVGDIDMETLEKEIQERFGKLTNPETSKEKASNEVPGHDETLVAITKDKENSFVAVQLIYKQPKKMDTTLMGFREYYLRSLYNAMLSQRMQELLQQPEPPFIFARSNYGGFIRAIDNYSSFAVVGEDGLLTGLEALVIENERVKQHGFTAGELQRAIQNLDNSLEQASKEVGKTESGQYASEYIRHFLEKEPSPGVAFELEFFRLITPTIQLEEINRMAQQWITDKNRVVIVTGIDKEGVTLPTEAEILEKLNNIDTDNIAPYEDNVSEEGLMEELPTPGKVVSESRNETTDITELTLSNGVKVVVKETNYKNDEIVMNAFSNGGHSLYGDDVYQSASMASAVVSQGGIKDLSIIDLQKMLTGKTVRVSPYIGELREGFNGGAAPKDFETMLQLVHLYFTQPRKDETSFQSMISRNKSLFQNIMASPQYYYSDQVAKIMSQDHLRGGGFPTPEQMDEVDLDKAYEVYRERFANAGDFTFVFVGNISVEEAKPLFETYLGSLPNIDRKEKWIDVGVRPPAGPLEKKVMKGTDPKSQVTINFVGEKKLPKKDRYLLSSLGEVLTNRLIEILREDESGVYGVGASGRASRKPYESYQFTIRFPCGPENVDRLTEAAFAEIRNIQENGVKDEDITKVREAQTKDREENLKKNPYWAAQLNAYYYNESNLDNFYQYEEYVKGLNSKDLQRVANEIIDLDKAIKIVLYPEEG